MGQVNQCSMGSFVSKAPDFALGIARHPSQIYAALLEGLSVFLFVQFRFWKSNVCQKKPGRLGGEFLITYALARMIGEFFREPDASLILGMSRGQFYSIFLLLGECLSFIWLKKNPLEPFKCPLTSKVLPSLFTM